MSASTCLALHAYVQRLDVQYGSIKVSVLCSCNDVYRSVFVPFLFLLHSVFSFTCMLGTCTAYREVRT